MIINHVNPLYCDVSCGVTQRYIRSLLLLFHLCEWLKITDDLHIICYADDTNIFYSSSDPKKLFDVVQGDCENTDGVSIVFSSKLEWLPLFC